MSKDNTPHRGSPQRHKGMKTSLYNDDKPIFQQGGSNIYTNANRIYVKTVNEQPNVMPYIDSQYTGQSHIVSQSQFVHVPVVERKNNFIRQVRPGVIQNVVRFSPLQGGQEATNLSRTKFEALDQNNRFQSVGSTFIPPPPQSFLINNAKIQENRSPSMGKTVFTSSNPPIQTNTFQSVKKTFVPHHIINQIPVYGSSVYGESVQQQRESDGNDQSQEVLMGYYEKLYAKYENEQRKTMAMSQQLSEAINQVNYLKTQLLQSQQQKKVIHHQKVVMSRKVIDRKLLHELLSQKWNRIVDEVIDRRKEACLRQVSNTVENCRVTIKIPGESVDQQVATYYRV